MPWPVWDYSIRIFDVGHMRNKNLRKTGQVMRAVFVVYFWNETAYLHGDR